MENFYSVLGYLAAIAIWFNANYKLDVTYGYNDSAKRSVWSLSFASRETHPENSPTDSKQPH